MNKKHLLGVISGFALATLLTSKLVFASCINYNLRAPKYGDEKSGRIVKQTTSAYGTNVVTYFGWKGSVINSWIYCPFHNSDVSKVVTFTDKGTYNLYYKYEEYPTKGKEVQMRFKTSMLTGHPCDLRGGLFPDGK